MPIAARERNPRRPVSAPSRSEKGNFQTWVQLYGSALRNYCRSITGSVWEGDDLAQDTWLKIWSATQGKGDNVQLTRTYLYRAAQHAWIDRNRKRKLPAESLPLDEQLQAPVPTDPAAVWAAMETLVIELSPLQRTTLLMIDILKYTAGEAAQLIGSTEGAVKAALHRARVRLRNAVEGSNRAVTAPRQDKVQSMEEDFLPGSLSDDVLVLAYMDAIRREDAAALVMLYNDARPQDVVPVVTLQSYRCSSLRSIAVDTPAADPVRNHLMLMSYGLAA
ncbi:RNA polymerase sigma factor [Paenibacillus barengoltzii]|uniref:Sigma-70 family RNA polymerase sigma factor n=1 Tax=Paenibacillus barengoltzii G22 TaxID=1235795 RepID=R9L4T1_9BACL|nr:sigma-70 family RNA polymerase sigma factor [Paenibacillus barengoltzii G22]